MKVGDIVVCIKSGYHVTKEGNIWKIPDHGRYSSGESISNFDGGGSIQKKDVRLATEAEIRAYGKGIRNISDISKDEINNNYQIY